jgi:nucleotide-binding universal stress UspA family protein
MYHSLLVPLDRSSSAEQALPLALSIARRAKARLDLVEVHAWYDPEDHHAGWLPFDHRLDVERKGQEQLYLEATAKWLTAMSPVSATAAVLAGSNALPEWVADSILERARASGTDLIVVATHRRGPLSRLALGSVADELLSRAGVPVLVLPAGESAPTLFPSLFPEPILSNILIPLDGSTLAEQVLDPALDLARLMEARCGLLRVVPPHFSSNGRGAAGRVPEIANAEGYLNRIAARLREQGLQVRTRVVVARHAAEAILTEAAAQTSHLIALATHGRGGLNRLLRGSVAEKILRTAALPVLVYHPTDKGR